jgi:hypothetical protein
MKTPSIYEKWRERVQHACQLGEKWSIGWAEVSFAAGYFSESHARIQNGRKEPGKTLVKQEVAMAAQSSAAARELQTVSAETSAIYLKDAYQQTAIIVPQSARPRAGRVLWRL